MRCVRAKAYFFGLLVLDCPSLSTESTAFDLFFLRENTALTICWFICHLCVIIEIDWTFYRVRVPGDNAILQASSRFTVYLRKGPIQIVAPGTRGINAKIPPKIKECSITKGIASKAPITIPQYISAAKGTMQMRKIISRSLDSIEDIGKERMRAGKNASR